MKNIVTTLIDKTKLHSHTHVHFKLLDKDGKEIHDSKEYPCFSPITYGQLSKDCHAILVIGYLEKIPYTFEIVEKWVAELTELGFPCTVSKVDAQTVNFLIAVKDYEKKYHLSSVLQLIRCLFEYLIYYVPDIYFNLINKKGNLDKFQLLQEAHKLLSSYKETAYFNSNHTITCAGTGGKNNLTREEFFSRLSKMKGNVFENNNFNTSLYKLWSSNKLEE
jgi:hypothetical protein